MVMESLFTSQTPTLPDVSEGVPVTVGTAIRFLVPGKVYGFRVYAPATVGGGTFAGALWQMTSPSAGTLLGAATFAALTPGWNTVLLGAPVDVVASVPYKVGLRTSEGRYAATGAFWTVQITNGNVVGIKDGDVVGGIAVANGSFISGLTNHPSNTFNSNGYWVDPLFEATPTGESHPTTGTGTIGLAGSAAVSTIRTTASTGTIGLAGSAISSGGDGGPPQEGASYEIEEIMTALAAVFNGVPTGDEISGTAVTLECHPEVVGQIDPPSIVLELDDLNWDLNMAAGADGWTVMALALVAYQDMAGAQRALWRFLSRKSTSGVARLKEALEADQTLGGLVSYAVMTNVRNIGIVTYNGVDYLGAELIIEVVSG
jgi:hypothetical protein